MAAYGVKLGINQKTALKLAAGFGGGMGNMGEACGAVTGAFMIIGLKHGSSDKDDELSGAKTDELIAQFVDKFNSRNSTISCRGLLGFDISAKDLSPESRIIISERCPGYVRDAAEIIEEIL